MSFAEIAQTSSFFLLMPSIGMVSGGDSESEGPEAQTRVWQKSPKQAPFSLRCHQSAGFRVEIPNLMVLRPRTFSFDELYRSGKNKILRKISKNRHIARALIFWGDIFLFCAPKLCKEAGPLNYFTITWQLFLPLLGH